METTDSGDAAPAENIGGDGALAARNCSRSWTTIQFKSVSSMAHKADWGTKVLLLAMLNSLRATCGIVVLGEPAREPFDEGGTDG